MKPPEKIHTKKGKQRIPERLADTKTLHAKIFYAPDETGIISSLKIPEVPEGLTILRSSDIPKNNELLLPMGTIPLLADREIAYCRQPILVVAGKKEEIINEFLSQIEIKITPENDRNISQIKTVKWQSKDFRSPSPDAHKVKSETYIPPFTERHIRNHSLLCKPSAKRFTIYSPTQWPSGIALNGKNCVGIDSANISVMNYEDSFSVQPYIVRPTLLAVLALILCRKTGHPIFFNNSEEAYQALSGSFYFKLEASLNSKKHISHLLGEIDIYLGRFSCFDQEIIDRIMLSTLSVYNIKKFSLKINLKRSPSAFITGLTTTGLYAGITAIELLVEKIAGETNDLPGIWREKNILQKNQTYATGFSMKTPFLESSIIEQLEYYTQYSRKHTANETLRRKNMPGVSGVIRGIGMSIGFNANSFLNPVFNEKKVSVTAELTKEGLLEISPSSEPVHNSIYKVWNRIIQETLDIPEKNIQFNFLDSSSGMLIAGKNISTVTDLIKKCCISIQKKRFRETLPITIKKNSNLATAPWAETRENRFPFPSYSKAGVVVEVEREQELPIPTIKKIVFTINCGAVELYEVVKGVIENETAEVCRWILGENAPSPIDLIKKIDVVFIDNKEKRSGIEGLAFATVPGALISAINQTMTKDLTTLPCSALSLLEGLE